MHIKTYYELTKPGIIYGNLLTAIAGFFLASRHPIHWGTFIAMILGTSFVIGGSCVFNNYIDRDIDHLMSRTKDRALVKNEVSPRSALIYGTVLLIGGSVILYFFTTMAALLAALLGAVVYVGLYTPLKRKSLYSTIVGSISGATPPVIGYCAVTNTFNLEGAILFLILVIWQMPHFYAIAIYRKDEYRSANVPLLPIIQGNRVAKIHILFYVIAFVLASASLTYFHFTGYIYLTVMLVVGLVWLWMSIQGFSKNKDEPKWARQMFLFSLIVLTVFSASLSLSGILY